MYSKIKNSWTNLSISAHQYMNTKSLFSFYVNNTPYHLLSYQLYYSVNDLARFGVLPVEFT